MSSISSYSNWVSLLLIEAKPSFGIDHCTDTWAHTNLYSKLYLCPGIKGLQIDLSKKGVYRVSLIGRDGERIKVFYAGRDTWWAASLAWSCACEIFLGAPFSRFLWNGLSQQRRDDIVRADEECRRNIERALKVKLDDTPGGIRGIKSKMASSNWDRYMYGVKYGYGYIRGCPRDQSH